MDVIQGASRAKAIDTNQPEEKLLHNNKDWSCIALSKDNKSRKNWTRKKYFQRSLGIQVKDLQEAGAPAPPKGKQSRIQALINNRINEWVQFPCTTVKTLNVELP